MKYIFSLYILLFLLISCSNKRKQKEEVKTDKKELMEVDREFSKMSEEKGMKTAFVEYIDSNGVLLRPGQMPIIGANAIDYLIQMNDTGFTLTWQPRNAGIAESGELGYTYGLYALRPGNTDSTIYGTYVNIWKRQKDGSWKFLLDSGNEGIDELD